MIVLVAIFLWRLLCIVLPGRIVLTENLPATYYVGNKNKSRDETEGRSITEIKKSVFERDCGKCLHCGVRCYLGKPSPDDISNGHRAASYGHWIPNSIGGPEVSENLHVSCMDCNKLMGSRVILEPAIAFAEKRGETICLDGLDVHRGKFKITDVYSEGEEWSWRVLSNKCKDA